MVPTFYARETIHRYTHLPKEKLIPIYEGPKSLSTADLQQVHIPGNVRAITNQKYILHVGVFEKRKNLPSLINAFQLLRDRGITGIKLVLVGQGSGKIYSDDVTAVKKAIASNQLEEEVLLTGYVTDDQLSFLYAHAFLYVFPSFNEGFGIPILEAFQFKLPVLVADNSCLPEVGGDAVLTFDPFNTEDIYEKMRQVIEDKNLRDILIKKGQQRLQSFSWEKTAKELIELFKRAHQS
jgi:glycosyltransferase involved in cell wall biosynthesis